MSTLPASPSDINSADTQADFFASALLLPKAERLASEATRAFEGAQESPKRPQESQRRRIGAEKLQVLKDWEGVVDEVRSDHFIARLLDRTSGARVDTEAAEIPFSEVSEDDRPLIMEGAIFYLTVYRVLTPPHGRVTRLFFRRLPAWTPSVLASARARAERWKKRFGVAKNSASG